MAIKKFGLIGCGGIADFHAEALRRIEDARLTYVSSRNEAKAQAVGEREGCAWTTDYRALLQSSEVDIVTVTTSSGSHFPIGMEVLKAGKHLLLEKPMAMTNQETESLIQTARKMGLTLGVVSQRRFEDQHLAVKKALAQGAIGQLLLAEVFLPFYRTQDYYDSADWRGTVAEDGGALMNQGIHSLDLLLWFAGEIETVYGKTATQTHRMEAEDLGLAIVQFKNGAFGTIMASTSIRPGFSACLNLYGEKGTIKLEGTSITLWEVPGISAPKFERTAAYGAAANPLNIVSDYHRNQIMDFIDALDAGRAPLVTGEDGARAVRLVNAIYESNAKGVPVQY